MEVPVVLFGSPDQSPERCFAIDPITSEDRLNGIIRLSNNISKKNANLI